MLILSSIILKKCKTPAVSVRDTSSKPLWGRYFWRLFCGAFVFAFLLTASISSLIAYSTYQYLSADLPVPSRERMMAMPESTRIYDRHGLLLYELYGDVKRSFVPLDKIPEDLVEASIAIEDKNFYRHEGYDLLAMLRAFYKNYRNEGLGQGASTITQQLARNMFLDREKSYRRKLRELILAREIEQRYSKDEIMELYLNNIPYGSVAYGVSAAAELYFGKDVEELDLLESAYLAALPKAPSDYSPFGTNRELLDARAEEVLQRMQLLGYISTSSLEKTLAQAKPEFRLRPHPILAPHFVFYVLDELEKRYGREEVRSGGMDVYTSLDYGWQKEAEKIIGKWGDINEKKYAAGNAALVAVDPASGEILSMVGSRDYFAPKIGAFNAATSPRQPGSSFKPYVYANAFEHGYTPDTIIVDARTDFAAANYGVSYVPRNYSGKHYGAVSARKALAGSLNVPAVKTIVAKGIGPTIDLAEKLGISTLGERKRFGPALALGGGELELIEHASAMGSFGNGGRHQEPVAIMTIRQRDGSLLYRHEAREPTQAVSEQSAYWINDILSDNKAREYIFGRSGKLSIPGQRVAVKTGTTQDFHDAWTIGYTPSISVGVWTGNNDNKPMKQGADGSFVAAPIWKEFMSFALTKVAKKDFAKPSNIAKEDKAKVLPKQKPVVEKKEDVIEKKNVLSGLVPQANAMEEIPLDAIAPALPRTGAFIMLPGGKGIVIN